MILFQAYNGLATDWYFRITSENKTC